MPQLFFSNKDAQGKPVQQRMVNTLRRTAQIQNLRSRERSAIVFETRLRRLASQQAIPTVIVQRAIYLSRKARKKQVVKKPSLQDWAFSLLLAACRELRFVVTIEDLTGTDKLSNVRRYYNLLKKSLGLKILPPDVSSYISYFSGKFDLSAPVMLRAIQISKEHKDLNSTPHCVAASALYIAIKEFGRNLSQKTFCQKVNISEITLRNWVSILGGHKTPMSILPEPKPEDLEEQNERTDGKHGSYNRAPEPAPPEKPLRDNNDTKHSKDHADKFNSRKKIRNQRVRKLRRSVKHASNPKKKATYRNHSPVKQVSSSQRRSPARRRTRTR